MEYDSMYYNLFENDRDLQSHQTKFENFLQTHLKIERGLTIGLVESNQVEMFSRWSSSKFDFLDLEATTEKKIPKGAKQDVSVHLIGLISLHNFCNFTTHYQTFQLEQTHSFIHFVYSRIDFVNTFTIMILYLAHNNRNIFYTLFFSHCHHWASICKLLTF